ncbi:MAG: flagellar biosynthetic protein FliQ [Candidatus Margulisiibacteriota bacterium]
MTIDSVHAVITKGILLILFCSGPAVGAGLLVGLAISVFQAVTQIQEQTLTFVPKMLTVLLVIAVIFPWIGSSIITYAQSLWVTIPTLVK